METTWFMVYSVTVASVDSRVISASTTRLWIIIRKAPCLRFSFIYFTRLSTSIPLLPSNESKSRSTNIFSRPRQNLQNVSCSSNLLHTRGTHLPNLQPRLSWGKRSGNTYWWETPWPTPGIQEAKTGEGEKRFSAKNKKLGEGWKCGLECGMGNIVVLGVWEVLCDVRLGFVATIRGETSHDLRSGDTFWNRAPRILEGCNK